MKTYEIIYRVNGGKEEMTLRFKGDRQELIDTLKYMKNESYYDITVEKVYSVNKNEIYISIVPPIKVRN